MGDFKEGTGIHVELHIGDGATPEVFASIGNVTNVEGPGIEVDIKEKSTLDDEFVRKVAGRIDGGDVSFELELDPTAATHKGLIAKAKGRQKHSFKVVFPAPWNASWSFSGIIRSFKPSVGEDGPTASLAIAVSGEPDFAETP
jgi:hypothetical protein